MPNLLGLFGYKTFPTVVYCKSCKLFKDRDANTIMLWVNMKSKAITLHLFAIAYINYNIALCIYASILVTEKAH